MWGKRAWIRCVIMLGVAFGASVCMAAELKGTGIVPSDDPVDKATLASDAEDFKIFEKLRLAAGTGFSADEMLDYGSILEFGSGPAGVDLKGAFDIYEKAADKGNQIAQVKMCVAYLLGEGRPRNPQKAYTDYCTKLPKTDETFLFSAAYDYEMGLSGPKDEAMALSLYGQAYQKGSAQAMDALGRILLAKGKPKNAATFLRQAIFNGSADAMDRLAGMLETGQDIEADVDEAWWLYVNAARRGNEHARQRLAQGPQRSLLPRSELLDGETSLITQTIPDKDGPRSKTFSPLKAGYEVFRRLPRGVYDNRVESRVELHCYINKHHIIDVCLMQREFPIGFGYGPILMALYSGKLSVADHDFKGRPTANTVYVQTYRWLFQ